MPTPRAPSLLRRALAGLLLGLALTSAVATPALAGKRRPVPTVVEDALAYVPTDRTKAARVLEDAIEHGDGLAAVDLPAVQIHAGEQRRLLDDTARARTWFEAAVSGGKDWEVRAGRLGLALLSATDGGAMSDDAWTILVETPEDEVLDTQNADRYLLLALRAASTDDVVGVRDYSKKALAFAKADPDVDARAREVLGRLGTPPAPAPAVEPGVDPVPAPVPAPPSLDVLSDLERAEKALMAQDSAEARRLAEKVIADADAAGDAADKRDLLAAKYVLRRIDAVAVAPHRVGVLLPLTGKYEAVGKQMQQAIEYGWKAGKGSATLEFTDSGSSAESAVKALEKLVLERGVIAVLGPLLTDESAAVAEAAQAMRVPLVSLSQGSDVAPVDDWVFQGMVTPREQVHALVAYVMVDRAMKDFAIFAPNTPYGHTAADAFTEAVTARGGTIRASQFYDPEATDLIPDAKKLGRKDYEARKSEYWELRRETARKGGNPERVVLPPILDFQGLFVPDSAKRISIACAALAYEEFPLGDFAPTKESPFIPMLGLSGWNSDVLLTAGPYVRQSIFTDAFYASSAADTKFVTAYAEKYGRNPGPIEAVAVDVGRLVARADASDPADRKGFREALMRATATDTVTGAKAFDATSRSAARRIRILTVTPTGIKPLDETETTPAPGPAPAPAPATAPAPKP